MDRTEHWDQIHERRSPRDVSWYERTPMISIRRVREAVEVGARSLLDVGAGASMLVDEALELGLGRIAVLDISQRALNASAERLGSGADQVEWIVGDVTAIDDVGVFDIWHDRAAFHFLTDVFDQERYVSFCERTVAPGVSRSLPRSLRTVRTCAAACRCGGTTRQNSLNVVVPDSSSPTPSAMST